MKHKISDSSRPLGQAFPDNECEHLYVQHKGSSARYIRTTCKHCGKVWQEERHKEEAKDPETCRHLNVGHRGSTKVMRRTFCKDCQTYVDEVAQELAKTMEKSQATPEEQALLERVVDHGSVSKTQARKAVELMAKETQRLDEGQYSMLDIGNMFIDCCDRALVIPTTPIK